MRLSSAASSDMSAAHYRTHKIFLISNCILLGAAPSCIILTLSLRLVPSAVGFLIILIQAVTIAGAISGYASANSTSSKWYIAHMVAKGISAILQGVVAILIFSRTSEFLFVELRSHVRVEDGEILLKMVGGLGVFIFCMEWVVLARALALMYFECADGDYGRRTAKVQKKI